MKHLPLYAAIASALTFSTFTHGQELELEEVIVIGTYFEDYKVDNAVGAMRIEASLLETAQSVTVIPEKIMSEQLATTLGEVLENDASLTAGSKQRNREVFNLRGFSLSSSTGYLRDGHQHWSHYQQPIETLERVEVIKGPSSILYGQSTPGGLVNMVTKKPVANRMLILGADVDQEGSTRFMLDAGGAINESESLRYRGVLVKQDVEYDRHYPNGDNRERDRFLGSIVVDYDVSDNLLLRFHFDHTKDKAGLDTGSWLDSNANVIGDRKLIRDFSWAFTDIEVQNYGADVMYAINTDWRVTLGYNKQTFERQRFESAPRKPSSFTAGQQYSSRPYDRFDDWQFETVFVDLVGEFSTGGIEHKLLLGANRLDYYYGQLRTRSSSIDYDISQLEPVRPPVSYKTDDTLYTSEYDFYGVYVQDLMTINEHWQVSFGGRYDKQSREGADSNSFVPKAGVMYHPNEDSTLYYSYSEGFEPQRSERLNDELDINNGMSLDAVESMQHELGVKWQLVDDRLMLTGSIFDISKEGELITESIEHPVYETRTTQAGEQRHKGVELAAQGAVTDRLFVMTSLINIDAKFERDERYSGNTPADVPKWSAALWSRYEFNNDFAINAGLFYEGKRYADNANTVRKDAYTRVDIGATYQFLIGDADVDVRFNIGNLFDKKYVVGGGLNNVTVADGRTFQVAARVEF